MDINTDVVVLALVEATAPKWQYLATFPINQFYALMIILVKDEEQRVCDCIITRGIYTPKFVITLMFLCMRLMH